MSLVRIRAFFLKFDHDLLPSRTGGQVSVLRSQWEVLLQCLDDGRNVSIRRPVIIDRIVLSCLSDCVALSMSNCITESSKALPLDVGDELGHRLSLVNLGASVVPNLISRAIEVCSGFLVFVHLLPGKAANPCPGLVCHAGVVEDEEEEVD